MAPQPIPFNRPTVIGNEFAYLQDAVKRGHTSSGGHYTKQVEHLLGEWFRSEDVILTTSCTDALELAALLCELEPGDEVIVPSYTFVSTALGFARAGANLVFADIENQYLSLDPKHVESLITDRTRAIVTVHYAGVAGPVTDLQELASGSISLIEDNAHGIFGSSAEGRLGSFGRFSTLSFHETKNFNCGEGGALVVNDSADPGRARVLTDKGTNRKAFFEGEVDKYSWQDTGSSFGLSDMLAGYLLAQLEQRETIQARRKAIYETYEAALQPIADAGAATLPRIPPASESAYHMFYLLLETPQARTDTLREMREQGVNATFHYVPLHSSPGGQKFAIRSDTLPVTDDISARLMRLPFHNALTDEDVARVIEVTTSSVLGKR